MIEQIFDLIGLIMKLLGWLAYVIFIYLWFFTEHINHIETNDLIVICLILIMIQL